MSIFPSHQFIIPFLLFQHIVPKIVVVHGVRCVDELIIEQSGAESGAEWTVWEVVSDTVQNLFLPYNPISKFCQELLNQIQIYAPKAKYQKDHHFPI